MRGLPVVILMFASVAGAASRPPAVAGSFYPADAGELRREVERALAGRPDTGAAAALVVPHAGYVFSGRVAATAFASLRGAAVRRVILLGPSHHLSFAGGALPAPGITAFATPLGAVAVDREAVESLRGHPDFAGPARAHDPEHCLEVELPFLQVAAPEARIVPILVGGAGDRALLKRLARALVPLLGDGTVVVVSSDFSHHGERYGWSPFAGPDVGERLLALGRLTAERLAAGDAAGFAHQVEVSGDTVCGVRPATVLAELVAHAFDGRGQVVEVTTSGHVSGRWDLSVTYAAVRFEGRWAEWRDDPGPPQLPRLTAAQGASVVALARAALDSYLLHDGSLASWYGSDHDAQATRAPAGAFVTLNRRDVAAGRPGRLRACMGVAEATQALEDAVIQAAVWAAQDPRFPRLEASEMADLEVDVSVLSPAHPVPGPEAIEVGTHGVILEKNGRRALFLPQVAVEQGWDRDTMLAQLARKAGLPADGWREGARFEVFTAQVFTEHR